MATAPRIGDTVKLPDGPSGELVAIDAGVEHGEPATYLTVRNSLGNLVTRWIR